MSVPRVAWARGCTGLGLVPSSFLICCFEPCPAADASRRCVRSQRGAAKCTRCGSAGGRRGAGPRRRRLRGADLPGDLPQRRQASSAPHRASAGSTRPPPHLLRSALQPTSCAPLSASLRCSLTRKMQRASIEGKASACMRTPQVAERSLPWCACGEDPGGEIRRGGVWNAGTRAARGFGAAKTAKTSAK